MAHWLHRLGTAFWPPTVAELPGPIDLVAGTVGGLRLGDSRWRVPEVLGRPDYPRRFDHYPSLTWTRFRLTIGFTRDDAIEHLRLANLDVTEPAFNPLVVLGDGLEVACAALTVAAVIAAFGEPTGGFGPPDGHHCLEWSRGGFVAYLDRHADGRLSGLGVTLPLGAVPGVAGLDWSP